MNLRVFLLAVLALATLASSRPVRKPRKVKTRPDLVRDPKQLALLQIHHNDDAKSDKNNPEGLDTSQMDSKPNEIAKKANKNIKKTENRKLKRNGSDQRKLRRRRGRRGGRRRGGRRRGGRRHRGRRDPPPPPPPPNVHMPLQNLRGPHHIDHDLPKNAKVNLFRVTCRMFHNCTHIRRPRGFEPEIIVPGSGRGPFPKKGQEKFNSTKVESRLDEPTLKQAVHDPTDELINHLGQFGKDRRVTLWIQSLFRQGRLPTNQNLMELVDKNYFVGHHRNIGNSRIADIDAIREMNYDQYFRHKQITIGRATQNQKLISDYGIEKSNQRHMWGFRRLRQIVYESILQMENIIYLEQNTLIRNIRERRQKFDLDQEKALNATMKELEGKPYYFTVYDRRDIFRD